MMDGYAISKLVGYGADTDLGSISADIRNETKTAEGCRPTRKNVVSASSPFFEKVVIQQNASTRSRNIDIVIRGIYSSTFTHFQVHSFCVRIISRDSHRAEEI